MKKLASIQALLYKTIYNQSGLDAVEKTIYIIAGVLAGTFIVGVVLVSIIGNGDGTGESFGDSIIRKLKEI